MTQTKQSNFAQNLGFFGLAAVLALAIFGPENPNSRQKATNYLEESGFTSVKVEDAVFCKNGNGLRRKFKAINEQGEEVSGTVCSDEITTD